MASRPELKEEDETSFCKFFRNLSDQDDIIRIFDRGDYYSSHGEDAKFIANHVGIINSRLRFCAHGSRSTVRPPLSESWGATQA